jgi:hypothetical protein
LIWWGSASTLSPFILVVALLWSFLLH